MRYPLLDPLRGLAAIWVFLHHLVYAYPVASAPNLFRMGYFGVPMFFVISGYCLTAAGRRAIQVGERPERFLLRRAKRIYPPYWAAVALAVVAYALLPLAGPPLCAAEEQMRDGWRTVDARKWFGVLTLTAGFRPSGELPWHKFYPVNLVFWTLAIEAQFYAVVWLAVRGGRHFYTILGGVTLASIPFAANTVAFSSGWFLPFWPFFSLGVALFALLDASHAAAPAGARCGCRAKRWFGLLIGAALAACGLAGAPLEPDGSREMVLGEFAFALGFASILWATWEPEPAGRGGGLRGAVLSYIGSASYSIYLIHIPLMLLTAHILVPLLPHEGLPFLAALVIVVCASVYPFHRWVEVPCQSSARHQASRPLSRPGESSCVNGAVSG